MAVASSKPGHLALCRPNPALRLCCGWTGTACQGAHPKAAADGVGVVPMSWSALLSSACSKSEKSQKATSS